MTTVGKAARFDPADTQAAERAFEAAEQHRIACCNWPAAYPYAPEASFRMFHTGDRLWLRFDVAERCTAARVKEDNGAVWTDSCVEFFLATDPMGYYNFEASAIGRLLLAWRRSRDVDVEHAGSDVLRGIVRLPSLGTEPFEEREGDNRWRLTLAIPPEALFRDALTAWDGVEARMNLYKCGDGLTRPHYLSWRPIGTDTPDFHRPECFDRVRFE